MAPEPQPGDVPVRRAGDLRLLMPADWWVVPLIDDAGRKRAIRGLLDKQFGTADSPPPLKHQMRGELTEVTAAAARTGGRVMAFSLMTVAGRPIPGTITTFREPVVMRRFGQENALPPLAKAARRAAAEPGVEVLQADGPLGRVVRAVDETTGPSQYGAQDVRQVRVRYWLDPDDGDGIFHVVCTTPELSLREPLLDLFDTIVASVGHVDDEAADAASDTDDDDTDDDDGPDETTVNLTPR